MIELLYEITLMNRVRSLRIRPGSGMVLCRLSGGRRLESDSNKGGRRAMMTIDQILTKLDRYYKEIS
ncbi:MAG: hypothetical protein ACLURV_13830 [Gallintestinimicrobium sp.]